MQLIPLQSKYTLLLYQIHFLITWFKYFEFIINHTSESCNKVNKNELFSNDHKSNHSINNDYDAYANIGNHSNDVVEIYIANGAMSAAFRVAFNDTLEESSDAKPEDLENKGVLFLRNESDESVKILINGLTVDVSSKEIAGPFLLEPGFLKFRTVLNNKTEGADVNIKVGFRTDITILGFNDSVITGSLIGFAKQNNLIYPKFGNDKFKVSIKDIKPISYDIKVMGIKAIEGSIPMCGLLKEGCR